LHPEGVIIRGYSGFYYVWDGSALWECKLRGKYRIRSQTFLPGDKVRISLLDEQKRQAVIEEVLPRKNELIRPNISNMDQAVVVLACKDPEPDWRLVDRLLVMIRANLAEPLICFNKADLVSTDEIAQMTKQYDKAGFPLLTVSTKKNWGLEALKKALAGKVSVFAGPSGVGKSSIMNMLEPGLRRKTGEISEKSARGRHTTRHVELLPLPYGAVVADTPGFSQVMLPQMKKEELAGYYREFDDYRSSCRFSSCLHRDEPQCAVKEAVEQGLINAGRYERYLVLLEEVKANERRY
jgi:ribosome biogenesis GTPase